MYADSITKKQVISFLKFIWVPAIPIRDRASRRYQLRILNYNLPWQDKYK